MRAWELNESVSIDPQNIKWVKVEFDQDAISAEDFNKYRNEYNNLAMREKNLLTDYIVNDKTFDNVDDALSYMLALIQPRIDAKKREEEKWSKHRWDAEGQPYAKQAELVSVNWLKRLKGNDFRDMERNVGYNPDSDDWDHGNMDDLAKSLKNRGVQEPVMIVVGLRDGYAYIGEGNHRIEAAYNADINKLPARVIVYNDAKSDRGYGTYTHNVRTDLTWNPDELESFPEEKYYTKPSQVFKSLAGISK